MTVDFGKLNLKKIQHVIDDLDNCLFLYPEHYAERFSIETGRAAKRMAEHKINKGSDNEDFVALACTHEDDLTQKAMDSYSTHGFTTRAFMHDYKLNELNLYRLHHYFISRDVIRPTFNRLANPRLIQGVTLLGDAGLDCHLFTNGTTNYAMNATEQLGLYNRYKTLGGIDSTDSQFLMPKHVRGAWHDFFAVAKIASTTGFMLQQQNFEDEDNQIKRHMKPQDWDFSHCVFFDDTPQNLAVAKHFKIQTVLVETDRVTYDPATMRYVDAVAENIAEFKCHMAQSIMQQQSSARPQSSFRPRRLTAI